jgi:hypothetical protein
MQANARSITEAGTPGDDDIVKLTKQVAELFKASFQRGPWPNETQCYSVAIWIDIVQKSKQYKKNFVQENARLRRRRAVIQEMKRLINQQKHVQLAGLQLSSWLEDDENLKALEVALEQATPALLRPFDPLAGERDKAWWHKAARMIAQKAQAALEQAGHKKVSFQKHGPFVEVVAAALKLAIGEDFEPATVASVLAKTTH